MIVVPPISAARLPDCYAPPSQLPETSPTRLPHRSQQNASLRSKADSSLDHSNRLRGRNGVVTRMLPDVHSPMSPARSTAHIPSSPRSDQQEAETGCLAGAVIPVGQSPTREPSGPAVSDEQLESPSDHHCQANQSLHRPSGRPPAATAAVRGSRSCVAAGTASNKRKASAGACHQPCFIDAINHPSEFEVDWPNIVQYASGFRAVK